LAKYRIPVEKLGLLRPKGMDVCKRDVKGRDAEPGKRGFLSWNLNTDGWVTVETREEYPELKDYEVG